VAKEGEYAQVRLPSGTIRIIHVRCRATVGQLGNIEHENEKIGGAGHKRHMGRRPQVRGVVMSPRDHPHGGGEAKSPVGGMAQTPWGKPAMGLKTRRNPKTDRFVIKPQKKRGK
jgi:large subunit ribosomal protein L2